MNEATCPFKNGLKCDKNCMLYDEQTRFCDLSQIAAHLQTIAEDGIYTYK